MGNCASSANKHALNREKRLIDIDLEVPLPSVPGSFSYRKEAMHSSVRIRFGTIADRATDISTKVVLLWLPGSGQCPDNELLRRTANFMHRNGNSSVHAIIGCTYSQADTFIGQCQKLYKHVVLGGHSAGAGMALNKAREVGLPCILFSTMPPNSDCTHPCLTVIGEHDGGRSFLTNDVRAASDDVMGVVVQRQMNKILIPYNGDHSLRVRELNDTREKDLFSNTPETLRMNDAVARHMETFIVQTGSPDPLQ